ncbi:MAG TPA: response regulator [Ruminiclostridium sp.]
MFKIMIVDDEMLALEYLSNIVEFEQFGFKIVCKARSGKEGVQKYKEFEPDLVIADIVMPEMNGLDMADDILSINPNCLIILLTSYNEFQYAQKAIKLEVKSYILKHEMSEENLSKELVRIHNILESRIQEIAPLRWEEFEKLFKLEDVKNIGLSGYSFNCLLGKYKIPFRNNSTYIFNLDFDIELESKLFKNNFFSFKNLLESFYIQDKANCELLMFKDNKAVLLYSMTEVVSHRRKEGMLLSSCSGIQNYVKDQYSTNVYIGVSRVLTEYEDLRTAYYETFDALKNKFFKKRNTLFFCGRLSIAEGDCVAERDNLLNSFRNALDTWNYQVALNSLRELLLEVHVNMSKMKLYNMDIDIIAGLLYKLVNVNVNRCYKMIEKCSYIEDVYCVFVEMLDEIYLSRSNKYSPRMISVLKYINQDLSKNLSLNDIADYVGINDVYLCQIFKKEVGVNYKTYLNEKKITKAEELLKTQKYKIYEIADMLGFQTVQHFCNTFRKITGRTPSQYRN